MEELIIGKSHSILVAKPENFTPPTKNPDDCICEAKGVPGAGRLLIANCPCCDGVQILVWKICNCEEGHPMRVSLPPNTTMRLRYIDNTEPIV